MRSSLVLKSAGVCALALIVVGAAATKSKETEGADAVPAVSAQASPTPAGDTIHRNLALQPAASQFSRKTGRRYRVNRGRSLMTVVLSVGGQSQNAQIVRSQTTDGERIQISLADGRPLSWSREEGASVAGGRGTVAERLLVERLVFDSPDQFVLAQLRGASYFVMGRNVRPDNAGENYSGPLWNIVRVSDAEIDEGRRPLSKWRLYYINTATGLIDRIESEVDGERIVAEFSGWTDVNGEKVPTEISWTSQGQRLMHYRLANFSHFAQ
ncbi:MAG TPA: hypothetical protein VJV21_03405 [Pyrinomonadaceae bacterium]|nr:hypothetical protein [Pyrinomonadaceae bacterium]